jgi:heat-inducible transcriptional repressor
MSNNSSNKKQERKFLVLEHIVHEYVSKGMPVSSKIVSQRMGGNISSATIRNIMAELEEQDYIAQPHTSAGRIPTHSGYRSYVDAVKNRIRLEKKQAQRLAAEYSLRIQSINDVIEKTSLLISRELHNAGVVMWPSIEDHYLKHMELIKLRAETVLAVLVTMTNAVKNFIVKLDRDIDKTELEKVSNFVNINYGHSSFSSISGGLRILLDGDVQREERETIDIAKTALSIVDAIIEENIDNEIYLEGLNFFLEQCESQDMDATRNIIQVFSERKDLVRLLKGELPHRGLRAYIGRENGCEILRECSIITCGYGVNSKTLGRIGVIGPMRMDYNLALQTVSCLSDLVSAKQKTKKSPARLKYRRKSLKNSEKKRKSATNITTSG